MCDSIDLITDRHHRHTQSFDWLKEAIGHPVRVLYGEDETLREYLPTLRTNPPRLLILFQLEQLAAWASCFCPVLGFPMHDLTRMTPDSYLASLKDVHWISFSRALHQRLAGMGLGSCHLQYAPDPAGFPQASWEKGPRAYFWERLPAELDESAVRAVLQALGVDALSIRKLGDARFYSDDHAERDRALQAWENRGSYLQNLARFNVFVAPRKHEGIGMAFLEAMAMGMMVVAENAPTANEYIISGKNGLLFGGDQDLLFLPARLSLEAMARMGRKARETIGRIHGEWVQSTVEIHKTVDFLLASAYPGKAPIPGLLEATLNFSHDPVSLWTLVAASHPASQVWRSHQREEANLSRKGFWRKLRWFLRYPRAGLLDLLQKR